MRKREKGFTLIELMITLLVASVLVGVAVPSFNTMIRNNRSVSLGEEIVAALNYARLEAVRSSSRVSVCVSSNTTSCTGEADWRVGFIVYVDSANSDINPVTSIDATRGVLKIWEAQDASARISVKQGATQANFIRFTSQGALGRVTNNPISIQEEVSGCTNNAARNILVSVAGQVSVKKINCW